MQKKLRESIVHPLRKSYFVRGDNISELRVAYAKCQDSCMDETKGLVFLKTLLDAILSDISDKAWYNLTVQPTADSQIITLDMLMKEQKVDEDATTVFIALSRPAQIQMVVVPSEDICVEGTTRHVTLNDFGFNTLNSSFILQVRRT